MSSKRSIGSLAALVVLLLGAFFLRIFRLDVQSLWWDEGISLHLATSSLAEIIANRAANTHPPLYFMALKGWVALVGTTPFAARYSSVLASLLQGTAVYTATRYWFKSTSIVWTATILIAISPLSVIYGQETRVYAFLPLVYLAVLIATTHLLRTMENGRNPSRKDWLGLAVAEWIGLHLHYVTIFMVAYVTIWAMVVLYRQKRWLEIRTWVGVQLGIGLASLPWIGVVLANWSAVQAEAGIGSYLTQPIAFTFMLAQVWVFHLTGLAGALARPAVAWLTGFAGLGLLVLLFIHWRQWRRSLQFALHWLVPLAMALGVWHLRSFSHPRYVAIYAIMLIPLASFLIAGSRRWWRTGWLGLPLVLLSIWGLWAYFYDPGVAKDDMRGVARYLETATLTSLSAGVSPDDLIMMPDAGWVLGFEYNGRVPIVMPNLTDQTETWRRLGQWTTNPRQIFTVESTRENRDWQGLVPFALEQAGALVDIQRFDGLIVRQYDVQDTAVPPQLAEIKADFGALQLTGAQIETDVPADSALTLALSWQMVAAAPRTYLDVKLLDIDGWPLANRYSLLLDASGRPTDFWEPGQNVMTYHTLPIPPGTPPLTYRLALGLGTETENGRQQPLDLLDAAGSPQGQQFVLTDALTLSSPIGLNNPYQLAWILPRLPEPALIAPGLSLAAAGLDRGEVGMGQSLAVSLEWAAEQGPLADLRPRLVLQQGETELAAAGDAPVQGRYPTTMWLTGEHVLEHRFLRVPAAAAAGTAVVGIAFDDVFVEIGSVEIVEQAYLFNPPLISSPVSIQFGQTARLVGYDLPLQQVATGEPVTLTLYWESLEDGGETSYTVFAHILGGNGRLIGQHDAPPVNGTRPTTGWVSGEYLIDPHPMVFRELDYAGEAIIEVGLYDPVTGTRLTAADGQDHYILPVTLQVTGGD